MLGTGAEGADTLVSMGTAFGFSVTTFFGFASLGLNVPSLLATTSDLLFA